MGKVKHLMRSLRSRLALAKRRFTSTCPLPSSSTVSSSPPPAANDERPASAPTSRTLLPFSFGDAHMPRPIQTKSVSLAIRRKSLPEAPNEMHAAVVRQYLVVREGTPSERHASAQAESAADLAMRKFSEKLPLEELDMIGRGLDQQPSLQVHAERSTNVCSRSEDAEELPLAAPEAGLVVRTAGLHSAGSIESEHRNRDPLADRSSETDLRSPHSRTPRLSSRSSKSSWSFACRSARSVEREHEHKAAENSNDDDASSFGSQEGWGVTSDDNGAGKQPVASHSDEQADAPTASGDDGVFSSVRHCEHESFVSDEEFGALPDWSEVEGDPEYNEPYVRDADMWSVTTKTSSVAPDSEDGVVPDVCPGAAVLRLHAGSNTSATEEPR